MKSKLLRKLRKQVSKEIYIYYEDGYWHVSFLNNNYGRHEWGFNEKSVAEYAALERGRVRISTLLQEYKKKRLKYLYHYYPW